MARTRGWALALTALLLAAPSTAGCLVAEDEVPDGGPTGSTNRTEPVRTVAVEALECEHGCFEPTVTLDANGTVFSTAIAGDLAVSRDGGQTFDVRKLPPPPVDGPAGRGDPLVQVSPWGDLYFSALVFQNGEFVGLQVAASPDGGRGWPTNTFVSLTEAPTSGAYGVDRQWLGFGEEGTVYLSYAQQTVQRIGPVGQTVATGLWVGRSDDGGDTFDEFSRAVPYEERCTLGQAGPPVVLADGRVALSFQADEPPCGDPRHGEARKAGVRVAISDDRGASWSLFDAYYGPDKQGTSFPVLTADGGSLHLALWNGSDRLLATSSTDGAESWSTPVPLSSPQVNVSTAPWITTTANGTPVAAWYTELDDGAQLHAASLDETDGAISGISDAREIGVTRGNGANTDFAHVVPTPDGGAALAWAQAGENATARLSFYVPPG